MKKILTMGTFDIPHAGHAAFLRECENYGEVMVGVNTDEFVEEYKGERPLFSYEERSQLILALGYTVLKNSSAGRTLIRRIRPDLVAIGSDWLKKDYMAQINMTPELFEQMGIGLLYLPYTDGISTTLIKERLWQPHQQKQ
jgi:glycerol-3-phosphate cytidylyltransferase